MHDEAAREAEHLTVKSTMWHELTWLPELRELAAIVRQRWPARVP